MRTLADQDPINARTNFLALLTATEAGCLRVALHGAWMKTRRENSPAMRAMRSDLSALLLDITRQMRAGA